MLKIGLHGSRHLRRGFYAAPCFHSPCRRRSSFRNVSSLNLHDANWPRSIIPVLASLSMLVSSLSKHSNFIMDHPVWPWVPERAQALFLVLGDTKFLSLANFYCDPWASPTSPSPVLICFIHALGTCSRALSSTSCYGRLRLGKRPLFKSAVYNSSLHSHTRCD